MHPTGPNSLNPTAHTDAHLDELASSIDRHARRPISDCALPRVTLIRADAPQEAVGEMLVPVVCLVVRGTKRVQLGIRQLTYTPGTFVLSALDFPITGRIVETPYRAVAIHLDSTVLVELLDAVDLPEARPSPGFSVGAGAPEVIDAMARLLRLLDRPQDRDVLGAAAEREVLYRVLRTPLGSVLRQFVAERHIASRVEPAIRWMREHLDQRADVGHLAALLHLSPSSLHRHFKAATGISPLQFQKQVRLQEARRLLLMGETNAAGAASRVGYSSATQFSREYARLFGAPPVRDAVSWGSS